MTADKGVLYGVGVGPGDPELVTLKALRVLRSAPVVAWPGPAEGPSLARAIAAPHLTGEQREIPVRMTLSADGMKEAYDSAARDVAAALDGGEDVAAICEGDPFFYGSFIYLFGRLAGRYRTEIVPGVSSLTACSAALGAPLAAGDDTLAVIPGPLDAETMKIRLADVEAAAFIKVGRHLGKIRGVLRELGLSAGALYVERATMESQRTVPLERAEGNAPYFSMVLVHRRGAAWR